jgi:hypothetical protein
VLLRLSIVGWFDDMVCTQSEKINDEKLRAVGMRNKVS